MLSFFLKISLLLPIVPRVIEVHEKDNGDVKFLTKRENEEVDDRGLSQEDQNWPEQKDVVGRAGGLSPYVSHCNNGGRSEIQACCFGCNGCICVTICES